MQGVSYRLTTDGRRGNRRSTKLNGGVLLFSFDAATKPMALQIEWTTDVVPAISEAIEQLDEASNPTRDNRHQHCG